VRGRGPAIEHAGRRHARTGANREDRRAGGRLFPDPVDDRCGWRWHVRHHHKIRMGGGQLGELRVRRVRHDVETTGEHGRASIGCRGVDVERAGCRQQLVGQQEVGHLGAGVVQQHGSGQQSRVVRRVDLLVGAGGQRYRVEVAHRLPGPDQAEADGAGEQWCSGGEGLQRCHSALRGGG
jgi:hypothetical protein